jgi:DNA mismatch repair protein MutS
MSKLTPLMKQFMDVKSLHPEKLILFRMGDFYETFFEDAKIASRILGITLTARNKGSDNAPDLAGFPYHALDQYLEKLIRAGQKVVIVEQMEDPKLAKGLVKRDIVEIITPGAILDEKYLNSKNNNFLASIYISKTDTPTYSNNSNNNGLALLDLSTGDFLFTELSLSSLKDELLRQMPREILVENDIVKTIITEMALDFNYSISVHNEWSYDLSDAIKILTRHFQIQTLESIGTNERKFACIAAAAALIYVKILKKDDMNHITSIRYYSLANYMILDETTRRNLEIFLSIRNNTRSGTLIDVLDETKTPMGARLLTQWLSYPLIIKQDINNRLEATEEFKDKIAYTKDLRNLFNEIGDLSRITSRLATQRVNPRDLLTLASFLEITPQIVQKLSIYSSVYIEILKNNINEFFDVVELIKKTIMPNPVMTIKEGNIINSGIHAELDELRQISTDGKSWIARLEETEKKNTGIPSLKVGFNKVFGYYIEITNTHKHKVPKNYICKQTLVNCERYISPLLKEHEARVLSTEERIKNIEYDIFIELRKKLAEHVPKLNEYVDILAQLDVLSNFGFISWQNNYARPIFNDNGILNAKNSKHPVIEKLFIDEPFIHNDVYLNNDDHKIILITGPNMAGKSTYLRQIGLIVLMAQIGCFVPCESVDMPIFDRVFTRVGASDNLTRGQSTFLVEMIETANILNSATPNSLILLDEIGRGTSTFDGLSLAWSIIEYIHDTPKISAKTLFATHYHELTELENIFNSVKNYNVAVKEWNDQIVFVRKIERGECSQSYGIQVARLAGVPQKVISRAKEILKNLETIEVTPQGQTSRMKKILNKNLQSNLFEMIIEDTENKDKKLAQIKEMLLDIDLNNTSPMQAYQKIDEMKKFLLD